MRVYCILIINLKSGLSCFYFQVPMNETDFNILWMGNHPKPDILRNLMPYQKVNHFPR